MLALLLICVYGFCYASDDTMLPLARIDNFTDVVRLFAMDDNAIVQKVDQCIVQTQRQVDDVLRLSLPERTFDNTMRSLYDIVGARADTRVLHLVNNALKPTGKGHDANMRLKHYCIELENHRGLYDTFMQYYEVAQQESLNADQQELLESLASHFCKDDPERQAPTEFHVQKEKEIKSLHTEFARNIEQCTLENNAAVMRTWYACQNEIAQHEGFADYAEKQINKMDRSVEEVEMLLQDTAHRLMCESRASADTSAAQYPRTVHDSPVDVPLVQHLFNKISNLFGFECTMPTHYRLFWHDDVVALALSDQLKKKVVAYVLADLFYREDKPGSNSFTVRVVPPIITEDRCEPGVFVAHANLVKGAPLNTVSARAIARKVAHVMGGVTSYPMEAGKGLESGYLISGIIDYLLDDEQFFASQQEEKIGSSILASTDQRKDLASCLLNASVGLGLSRGIVPEVMLEQMNQQYGSWFTEEEIKNRMFGYLAFMQNDPATLYQQLENRILIADLCGTLKERGTLYSNGLRDAYTQLFTQAKDMQQFKELLKDFLEHEPNSKAFFKNLNI